MYNPQITVERIKQLLDDANMSGAKLNEKCNLNKNTIATSANSKMGLSATILFNISEQLNCSVDYLLGRTDNPAAHKSEHNIANGNYNAVGNDNSVTVNTPQFDNHKKLLLELYDEMTPAEQVQLLAKLSDKKQSGSDVGKQ